MAVPRPVLLALLGLALVASVFLVTRSGSNESVNAPAKSGVKAPVTPAQPSQTHRAKPAAAAHRATHASPAHAPAAPGAAALPGVKTKPVKTAAPAHAPASSSAPTGVLKAAQALGQDKAVVFLFSSPGAADDTATRTSVRSLRGLPRVEIFDATLDQVAAYRPMLSGLGISQIPSTVIVRPGKRAILLQGFVDAGTLRQNVADALR